MKGTLPPPEMDAAVGGGGARLSTRVHFLPSFPSIKVRVLSTVPRPPAPHPVLCTCAAHRTPRRSRARAGLRRALVLRLPVFSMNVTTILFLGVQDPEEGAPHTLAASSFSTQGEVPCRAHAHAHAHAHARARARAPHPVQDQVLFFALVTNGLRFCNLAC